MSEAGGTQMASMIVTCMLQTHMRPTVYHAVLEVHCSRLARAPPANITCTGMSPARGVVGKVAAALRIHMWYGFCGLPRLRLDFRSVLTYMHAHMGSEGHTGHACTIAPYGCSLMVMHRFSAAFPALPGFVNVCALSHVPTRLGVV